MTETVPIYTISSSVLFKCSASITAVFRVQSRFVKVNVIASGLVLKIKLI